LTQIFIVAIIKPTIIVGFMKISKKTEYGLIAMVFLAKNKGVHPLREIARKTRAPFDFLEKIFSQLEKAKLIKAKRGVAGGYSLAHPANKITPGDIVAVLDENISRAHCSGCPMARSCSSENVWLEVQASLDKSLNSTTLADLIK